MPLQIHVCFHHFDYIAAHCTSQVCLKYEGFPSSKVSQIPQLGERKKRLSFVPRPSAIRNDGEGEKKKSEWGQVLKLGKGGGGW